MSEITAEQQKENIDQKALELAQDFSYDGYQVVRRELFAHLKEPAVVIRRDSVTFNTACIAGLEDAVYIQILVNQDNKRMVVRKCEENDKDALRWCVEKPDKRKSRKMTNKLFSAMIYDMKGDFVQKTDANDTPAELTKEQMEEQQKEEIAAKVERKLNRIPFYPKEWKDSFGLPVEEHKKTLETNLTEGYVEFSPIM